MFFHKTEVQYTIILMFMTQQLADIESQLQSATSHSFSLQKELLSKDAAVASLTQENQRLREESKTSAKHSSQLKQECREKRAFNASLQKQVRVVII